MRFIQQDGSLPPLAESNAHGAAPDADDDLAAQLETCGIHVTRSRSHWQFRSGRDTFVAFSVESTLADWDTDAGLCTNGPHAAHVPDTRVRIWWASGALLLVFASGHIRWIPAPAFRWFATLTAGRPAYATQGDLILHGLAGDELAPHHAHVDRTLPADTRHCWCPPVHTIDEPAGVWLDVVEVAAGGNRRHLARGAMRLRYPWRRDMRTAQIRTRGPVEIAHDPVDDVHPTLTLPAQASFLISKLPGFSDPRTELRTPSGVVG